MIFPARLARPARSCLPASRISLEKAYPMNYDFDQRINRNDTHSMKWDYIKRDGRLVRWDETDASRHDRPVLPLWVADMDFPCAQPVIDAVTEQARQGLYGYTIPPQSYYESAVRWMNRRHNWIVQPEHICFTPGVVPALHLLVSAYVKPGEKVLVQPPVYYPFYYAIENTQTLAALNPLKYENGGYTMDFDDLVQKCADPDVKLAILCHPHNPVGRVWSQEELMRFGRICMDNDVLVVSDEIHCDLILGGRTFTPYATLGSEYEDRSIICTSPSKTFNLAGLQASNMVIPNEVLRETFQDTVGRSGYFTLNPFGIAAVEAAYDHGEEWLDQLLVYLEGNYRLVESFVRERLPEVSVVETEGTYLVWADFRNLGLDGQALEHLMLNEARVYFDEGYIFGPEGEGFERINIACPRSILAEALERIEAVVKGLNSI